MPWNNQTPNLFSHLKLQLSKMCFINYSHTAITKWKSIHRPPLLNVSWIPLPRFIGSSPYAFCSNHTVLLTDLRIYYSEYTSLIWNTHLFLSEVTWKIPTHISSLTFNIPHSEKTSLVHSDRMKSLSFHICISDSVFLGHRTIHHELQILLLIIQNIY